ncbi:hypothetical protein ACN1S1_003356 [Vibrio cholerae]
MSFSKIKYFLVAILLCLYSFPAAYAMDGTVIVKQPELEKKLGCKELDGEPLICLSSITWHENPKAYIYEFEIKTNYNSRDVDGLININIRQVSSVLNPLTASFYDVEPLLVEKLNQGKYSAKDIMVAFKVTNVGDKYTAFIYPRLINEKIVLYYDFLEGAVDVYSFLVSKCDNVKLVNSDIRVDVYNKFCVYTN